MSSAERATRLSRSWPRWLRWLVVVALTLPLHLGCRAPVPTLANVGRDISYAEVAAPGTPEVWARVARDVERDGRHRVLTIERGDEALEWRLNLIRSARRTIDLQTFIWTNDEAGRRILWELLQAVTQRGVRVRLIVDQMFSASDVGAIAFVASVDPRLELEFFHPNAERLAPGFWGTVTAAVVDFDRVNARMHNKVLIVDDQVAISGGRNYANEYFDLTIGLNFKDRDVLVVGPEVERATESFQTYWEAPNTVPARELVDVRAVLESGAVPAFRTERDFAGYGLFEGHSARASDPAFIEARLEESLVPAESVRFVADPPYKRRGDQPVSAINRALIDLARSATERVLIQTPYLVLSDDAIALFRELREKETSPDVWVSTNSLAATDSWPTYAASYAQKRVYLKELGFRIGEFRPIPQDIHDMLAYLPLLDRLPTPREAELGGEIPFRLDPTIEPVVVADRGERRTIDSRVNPHLGRAPFLCLHQKTLVVDRSAVFVGSYNLDPRSEDTNTECGFVVRGSALVDRIRSEIERDLEPQNAYLIAEARSPLAPSEVVGFFESVSASVPVDLWPWRSATSYAIRPDRPIGPPPFDRDHPQFEAYWEDVGSFPLLEGLRTKRFRARLFKGFGQVLFPLL